MALGDRSTALRDGEFSIGLTSDVEVMFLLGMPHRPRPAVPQLSGQSNTPDQSVAPRCPDGPTTIMPRSVKLGLATGRGNREIGQHSQGEAVSTSQINHLGKFSTRRPLLGADPPAPDSVARWHRDGPPARHRPASSPWPESPRPGCPARPPYPR